MTAPGAAPLLSVRERRSYLATRQGVVRAVDRVSLTVREAEGLGIVGESGCGKSVTCRTIMGLVPAGLAYTSDEVIYHPHITAPRHAYTVALLDALPQPRRQDPQGPLRSIPGSPPGLIDVPGGCRFAPRCPLAVDKCQTWETELLQAGEAGHTARCWRHDQVQAAGRVHE